MKKFTLHRLGAIIIFLFYIQFSIAQEIVTVTDCNLNGWRRQLPPNTSLIFKSEPGQAILGKGSMEFVTLTRNFVRFRNTLYDGTLLLNLTEFSYSCYIKNRENDLDANFVVLQIDLNGDGRTDDNLEFDPRFQTGHYVTGIAPDQGPTKVGVWQTWDLFHGVFWVGPPPRLDPDQGGEVLTLKDYIKRNPTARIINDANTGGGGIRLSAGAPEPIFAANYIGYADNVRIGVNGVTKVYDFEFSIADAGSDANVILGYGSNCTTLEGRSHGGVAPYTFSWLPAGSINGNTTTVCPLQSTTYTLTVTDANGCIGKDDVTVFVNDVRCGNKSDKVSICHGLQTICVSGDAVEAHLQHGDLLGDCPSGQKFGTAGDAALQEIKVNQITARNFPNPFRNSTSIQYTIPFKGQVSLEVYDNSGKMVSRLVNGLQVAGKYSVEFKPSKTGNGMYRFRIILADGIRYLSQSGTMLNQQ